MASQDIYLPAAILRALVSQMYTYRLPQPLELVVVVKTEDLDY